MKHTIKPYVYALFTIILIISLMHTQHYTILIGMVPYSFASTSHFILTFFMIMSFSVVLGATILGLITRRMALDKTLCFTLLLSFLICVTLRLPTTFMLNELDLTVYSPCFNLVFTLCTVTSIAHFKGKEVLALHLIFIGLFALVLGFLVLYLNRSNLGFYSFLALVLLPFILEIIEAGYIIAYPNYILASLSSPTGGIGSSSGGSSGIGSSSSGSSGGDGGG